MQPVKSLKFRRQAYLLTETCVGLALVGLILGVASLLLTQHARANDYFLNMRRAQLAAESCLERMRVGALLAVDAEYKDDAGIAYEIRVTDLEPQWRPLRHVRVTVSIEGRSAGTARYTVAAYLMPTEPPAGVRP